MSIRRDIAAAHSTQKIVRVVSKAESGWFEGYIVTVGQNFFVLEIFSDTVHLDGFVCLSFSDIESCTLPSPYHEFFEAVVKARDLKRYNPPALKLDSMLGLLRSIQAHGGVVTLHMEFDDSEEEKIPEDLSRVCYIGQILAVDDDTVVLQSIAPGAIWEEEAETYYLEDITRVSFGGGYEEALMIGGMAQRSSLI